MEIKYFARNAKITDIFKETVEKKLEKFNRIEEILRIKVELAYETNPSRGAQAYKVELTAPIGSQLLRAEAKADNEFTALDAALAKFSERVRRDSDRRKSKDKSSKLEFVEPDYSNIADSTADIASATFDSSSQGPLAEYGEFQLGDSPVIIRKKVHEDVPMSLEDAIYNMEMLDHDFYIFIDKNSKNPAVVYRRKGYSYGVLEITEK